MEEAIRVLYVEDDDLLAELTREHLEVQGFEVHHYPDAEKAIVGLRKQAMDIVLLDVGLPGMDGFELARNIRLQDEKVPMIFLTARSQSEDKLEGLRIGADDYLVKPFSIEELVLKMTAMLRRSGHPRYKKGKGCRFGNSLFDPTQRKLVIGEERFVLSHKEASILQKLVQASGEVVKRDEILISVWGDNSYFNGRSLDVFMSKLRKMLKGDDQVQILSLHGIGYRFVSQTPVVFE